MNPLPVTGGSAGGFKPRGLPSKGALDYVKVALELLLLLLAVPWIMRELAKHPRELSHQAASKHLKGS